MWIYEKQHVVYNRRMAAGGEYKSRIIIRQYHARRHPQLLIKFYISFKGPCFSLAALLDVT
jgi:hypothetical protein